ncbi:hypothetical protein [uncultured Alistipes sp.]|uniref:hypothetical protein n=1 Tax=uncultured Alistipes sp. TaxID=538949 RepID=UPI002730B94B|nr:hypothetical protein [uncultured Alistipes sp.]
MAAPKPSYTYRLFSLDCNRNPIQKAKKSVLYPYTKGNPKIRESIPDFAAPIGENNPQIPYFAKQRFKAKKSVFSKNSHSFPIFH